MRASWQRARVLSTPVLGGAQDLDTGVYTGAQTPAEVYVGDLDIQDPGTLFQRDREGQRFAGETHRAYLPRAREHMIRVIRPDMRVEAVAATGELVTYTILGVRELDGSLVLQEVGRAPVTP